MKKGGFQHFAIHPQYIEWLTPISQFFIFLLTKVCASSMISFECDLQSQFTRIVSTERMSVSYS